jgi:predicted nucleotidyltransferase
MKNTKSIDQNIQPLVDELVRNFDITKIILFGSHAWGTPHKDSDYDLCVIEKSIESKKQRLRDLSELAGKINITVPTDLISYTPEEIDERSKLGDFFVRKILNEGKILYEHRT